MSTDTIRSRSRHLLVIIDRALVRDQIVDYLTQQGYMVTGVADGDVAMRLCIVNVYDCMIVDVSTPRPNGIVFIQRLRERTSTPIIAIGARRDEINRLQILQVGADDYLLKPCHLPELEMRIYVILRRITMVRQVLRAPYIQLAPNNRTIVVNQKVVDTTPMEFAILQTLMSAPGQVFSRKELTTMMLGVQDRIGRAIDVHISNIRNKIEPNPDDPQYIVTVYGRGYMFRDRQSPASI